MFKAQNDYIGPSKYTHTIHTRNFKGFEGTFFFYPFRGSGRSRVYYLNAVLTAVYAWTPEQINYYVQGIIYFIDRN